MDEKELIAKIISGEEQAFRELYRVFADKVYNTCLGMLQQTEEAEDATQEVFIEVFRSASTFKGLSSLQTWLYRIAVNKCLDIQKKKKASKRFAFIKSIWGAEEDLQVDQPHFDHPGVLLENKEHAKVLFAAIKQLPEKQQAAFTLNKLEGLSYSETADVMQTTTAAVESLIFRANENLRHSLSEYYKDNISGGASSLQAFLLIL
ncbi:MAG: RNA polymerase sigma factor [Bacteroidota bacterium]|jgi:RNA polymerase sigma factor (sigma-70 family)|nr:RNA polymerase sigma factor [Sphingobacteriales bacterium]